MVSTFYHVHTFNALDNESKQTMKQSTEGLAPFRSMTLNSTHLLCVCLISLSLVLQSCSFDTLENGVFPQQLSTVDTAQSGSGGTVQWTVQGKSYTAKAKYTAATHVLSIHADADNYLDFSLSPSSTLSVGSYTLNPVAIMPGTASINLKQKNSDGTGCLSYGVAINGSLVVSSANSALCSGSFQFNATGAQLGSGSIITVSVSGTFSNVPVR